MGRKHESRYTSNLKRDFDDKGLRPPRLMVPLGFPKTRALRLLFFSTKNSMKVSDRNRFKRVWVPEYGGRGLEQQIFHWAMEIPAPAGMENDLRSAVEQRKE